MLYGSVMREAAALTCLAAMAHEHRLRIVRLLVREGPSGLPAGDISAKIGITPTAASFHLKELERAGLLRASRHGRYIRYAVSIDALRGLLTFLTEECCQGRPEICGQIFADAGGLSSPRGRKRKMEPSDV